MLAEIDETEWGTPTRRIDIIYQIDYEIYKSGYQEFELPAQEIELDIFKSSSNLMQYYRGVIFYFEKLYERSLMYIMCQAYYNRPYSLLAPYKLPTIISLELAESSCEKFFIPMITNRFIYEINTTN